MYCIQKLIYIKSVTYHVVYQNLVSYKHIHYHITKESKTFIKIIFSIIVQYSIIVSAIVNCYE
jgi:hypothetical protein